ncbi:MAG: hypothetical protein D6741_04605, partial [Planctomycetota bacterium]
IEPLLDLGYRASTLVKGLSAARKPWPENIDEWGHYQHAADGNPVAQDFVVGPPRHYQWVAGPEYLRAHDTDSSVSMAVTAGGRMFYFVDEAPSSTPGQHDLPDKWFLAARDAFNGVLLWKIPVEDWGWRAWKHTWFLARPGDIPLNIQMRLVAVGDRVYVTLGYRAPISELDAATGEVLRIYPQTAGAREILYHEGTLIASVPAASGALPARVMAVDASTGETLWISEKDYRGTDQDYIRWSESRGGVTPPVLQPALNPATDGKIVAVIDFDTVAAIDFASGKELWRTPIPDEEKGMWLGSLITVDGVVVVGLPQQLLGLDATSGKILWRKPKAPIGHLWYEWKDQFVIDGLVWTWNAELDTWDYVRNGAKGRTKLPTHVVAYDLHTGELKRSVPTGPIFLTYHHHRCYRNKATPKYILASRRGSEFIDLSGEGPHTVDNWVRGTCHFGMLLANGLQYAPPHPCRCYVLEKLGGFNALAPARDLGPMLAPDDPARLVRGPAFGDADGPAASADDWPTYRYDGLHSGAAPGTVPVEQAVRWKTELNTKLTAPTVVGDRVYVGLPERNTLAALDRTDGKIVWTYTTGSRIDSPPTYAKGKLVFGSADGFVYCLRARDGALVWRFQAAPQQRQIGAYGKLESAWPVHGSVLVVDGTVYFAAGRSSHLDGGIDVFALSLEDGSLKHHRNLNGPFYDSENIEANLGLPEGYLADILQADGDAIIMRGYRMDRTLSEVAPAKTSTLGAKGGFLDDTYFQRYFWYVDQVNNHARLAVVSPKIAWMVRMFDKISALDPKHYFTPGQGYTLFAVDRATRKNLWTLKVPVRVRAMATVGDRLVTAGPPDVLDPEDPLGAFEGRKGGLLDVFEAQTGKRLAGYKLHSPPVFNGIAAAHGELIVCHEDGSITCRGAK